MGKLIDLVEQEGIIMETKNRTKVVTVVLMFFSINVLLQHTKHSYNK